MDKKEMRKAYKERKITGGVYIIRNNVTGKILLKSVIDLRGSLNQFEFSVMTNSSPHMKLNEDWKAYKSSSFSIEVLEELEKKETQTDKEFKEDITLLEEIWQDKLQDADKY